MKALKLIFVNLLCLIGMLTITVGAGAQEKLTKQERKEVKKAQLAANFHALDSLLMSRKFVLEAEFLRDNYGNMASVTSELNFIKINGTNGVLQTGTPTGFGYNGVGGVTAEGNVENWKISKNFRNLNFTVQFNIMTNLGNYDVLMTVNADNNANATISGSTAGKLTWQGHLFSPGSSRAFKGQTTY